MNARPQIRVAESEPAYGRISHRSAVATGPRRWTPIVIEGGRHAKAGSSEPPGAMRRLNYFILALVAVFIGFGYLIVLPAMVLGLTAWLSWTALKKARAGLAAITREP